MSPANTKLKVILEAPKFDLSLLGKEIRIRAGEPLDINLPMIGTPMPEVKWAREGTELQPTHALQMETDDSHARLLIPISKRSDAGTYFVTASNTHGKAEASVKVTVLGMLTHVQYSRLQLIKTKSILA